MTAQGHPCTPALPVPIWHQTGRKRDRRDAGGRNMQISKAFQPALFINFHKLCLCLALQALFDVSCVVMHSNSNGIIYLLSFPAIKWAPLPHGFILKEEYTIFLQKTF